MASETMQIVGDGCTTHLGQIFAPVTKAGAAALPASYMGQSMLARQAFPQFRLALGALSLLPQYPEQWLIGVNRDAAPLLTAGAFLPEGDRAASLPRLFEP
jgi:hypothetical protein